MGCFFACFGSSKRLKNHRKSPPSTINQRNAIPNPAQSSLHTLPHHSNFKFSHPTGNKDEHIALPLEDPASVHSKKQGLKEEEEDSVENSSKDESSSEDFFVPLNPNFKSSFPPNRYGNCEDSDDEDEVFDSHLASDENDQFGMAESESSMNFCRLNPTNVRHRTAYVCSVLNPVENLSQWNAVKSKKAFPSTLQKENVELEQESSVEESPSTLQKESVQLEEESSVEEFPDSSSKPSREVCVDASLSNWLASSEATPISKITATMALEATITPMKSGTLQGSSSAKRSSHGEMPEVGAVGMYCKEGVSDKDRDSASSFKGIPNTNSKYREDKKVNWHSTPFETRLERALNSRGVVA